MDIRILEKSKKIGYIFNILYNGKNFDAFDEIKNKETVKGYFKKIMNSIGLTWAKGIQQGGRTDAKVSGNNYLYISSNFSGNIQKIIDIFNQEAREKLKIIKYYKTFPNLVFPDYIEKRKYIYRYPKKKIKNSLDKINRLCKELSGTYDVSRFTDSKGKELKEHTRNVEIQFIDGNLVFVGNSFMPKQVRIMSNYILNSEMLPLPGKYLNLEKVYLKKELISNIFIEEKNQKIENIKKIERTKDKKITICYVRKDKKAEIIGKNGKNIKKLRKEYENIIVREL